MAAWATTPSTVVPTTLVMLAQPPRAAADGDGHGNDTIVAQDSQETLDGGTGNDSLNSGGTGEFGDSSVQTGGTWR